MVYYLEYPSPIGTLVLTSDGITLTGLYMDRQPKTGEYPGREITVLAEAAAWLDRYFQGNADPISFPLAPKGTVFQQRVWKRLLEIPWGKTCTYGDIAREIALESGKRMSAQAVGGAVGSNPISILIPCHRVVGAGGKLTGYEWGLERKQWLLRHEGRKGLKEK